MAHPRPHLWTGFAVEKNQLGGLSCKILAWAAAGLIPTGTGDLNGLAPAVIETINSYMEAPAAHLLEFGFGPEMAIRGGLHLLKKVTITTALARVLGEWPF